MHKVAPALGEPMCNALPACDSNSALAGIGKKTSWAVLQRIAAHQDALRLVGQEQELDVRTAAKVEAFVCNLYPTSKSKERTTDELR